MTIGTTEGRLILALNGATKPFDDVGVRRARAHAIDRRAFVEGVLSGYGVPIGSHYVPRDPGYIDLTGVYPFDPAKAKQLLADAGVAPGTGITITLPPPAYARRGGEVIAAELQQVGINAKLVPMEWTQWLGQVFAHSEFDSTIIAHTEPRDLDIYARPRYYFNYHSPEYDALYKQYLAALDLKTQVELVQQLQRLLATDEPNVFIAALPKIGVWNAKLHGVWANNPIPANDVTGVTWSD